MPRLICFFAEAPVQSSSKKSAQFLPKISQDKAVEAKLDTVPKKVDVTVSTEDIGAEGLEREELRKMLKDELRQPIEKRLMKIEAQLTKNQATVNQKMSAVEAVLSDVKNGVIEVEQGTRQVVSYFLESRHSAMSDL